MKTIAQIIILTTGMGISAFVPSPIFHNTNNNNNINNGAFLPISKPTTTSSTKLMAEPLATEGPWKAYLDEETTGLIYYFNTDTGESTWEPPTPTFPTIKMAKGQKDEMMAIRNKYVQEQGLAEEEEESGGGAASGGVVGGGLFGGIGNFFSGTNEAASNTAAADATEEVVQEPVETVSDASTTSQSSSNKGFLNTFNSLFAPSTDTTTTTTTSTTTEPMSTTTTTSSSSTSEPIPMEEPEPVVEPEWKPISIEIGSKVLPHPEKVSWGGEDAIFIKGRCFGVFDGVSGAEKITGKPLYSLTLAKQMTTSVGMKGLTVKELKTKLQTAANYANDYATGASTAVIGSIGEDGFLRVLNLGDSVLLLIRNGKIVSKTKEIIHFFDCPYQLANESPDRASDGTVIQMEVLAGDVVVLGSDGVFDNVTDDYVISAVQEAGTTGKPSIIANKIVAESRKVSLDVNAPTPYAKLAKKNRYSEYAKGVGGKVDDISCVVVRCK